MISYIANERRKSNESNPMYDRKAIMTAAWAIHRKGAAGRAERRAQGETFPSERKLFGNALRTAWREAKDAARAAVWEARQAKLAEVPATKADTIRASIHDLNMKTRWSAADYERRDSLASQLRAA